MRSIPLSPVAAALIVLAPAVFLALCLFPAGAEDLPVGDDEDGDLGELLDDIAEEQGKRWWNKQWRFRRRVVIEDPALLILSGKMCTLERPDPLLIYNSGRCRDGLADLRVVTEEGKILPSGVVNFGQDDGTSFIWFRIPTTHAKMRLSLYLYHGNPRAKAAPGGSVPPVSRPPLNVIVLDEEEARGELLYDMPVGRPFFEDLVVVEAEASTDDEGRPVLRNRKKSTQKLWRIERKSEERERTSAGAYLAPTIPWRPEKLDAPVVAWAGARIPSAGLWYVHVRYRTSVYYPLGHPRAAQPAQRFVPFTLMLGGREYTCGARQERGAVFRWDSFSAELPEGKLKVGFRMTGLSGPDCVLFTTNSRYRPDHRDVNGPVWMRFKVLDRKVKPFFISLTCVVDPWSRISKSAGYVFRDRVVPTRMDVKLLCKEPENLLEPGSWSPWIRALDSTAPSWWSHACFYSGAHGRHHGVGPSRLSLRDVKAAFEFASRPHPARVFREGAEQDGNKDGSVGLHVIMPRGLGFEQLLDRTLSFAQWAKKRFGFIQTMKLEQNQGPKTIMFTTMAKAVTTEETEYILKTCGLLGFNGIEVAGPPGRDRFVKLARANGLEWTAAHHWHLKFDITTLPSKPSPGTTYIETLNHFLEAEAKKCYAPDRPQWGHPEFRAKLAIMGDEIGPATRAEYINILPLLKGAFHEYLQRHGLTPEFFGKKEWKEVDAFTYGKIREGSESWKTLTHIMSAQGIEIPSDLPQLPDNDLDVTGRAGEREDEADLSLLEEERQSEARLSGAPSRDVSIHERRIYHWTQRFRSWYTTRFYGLSHAELQRVAREELKLPWKPKASPNFQAMPTMCGQMWNGALNLFEWARSGTTNFLFHEDWINGPYRVAFGLRLLKAAARKHGQGVGALIVADRGFKQRFLMGIASESRAFLSYTYGPRRTIGPAWADSEPTIRAWAQLLRLVAKCEEDLLEARMRPADAAILIANTSEINTAYLSTSFYRRSRPLRDRYDIFAALMDAHIPVEIIGEEEIIEDNALKRYRTLYVADPHVDSRAQEKIKEWVGAGGVLWASHAGLARQEYNEPSLLFDEVFGLASRGDVVAAPDGWDTESGEQIVVDQGELLPPVTFPAAPCRPEWKLGKGEMLARYGDGTPAFIHNGFGKGRAFLFGNATFACTGGYGPEVEEPAWAASSRELVAVAARVAGVRLHVRLNHARVLWSVQDGPGRTILILASCFTEDIDDLSVELYMPRKPTSAYSGRSDKIDFEWLSDRARIILDLAKGDGEIVVFKYDG